MDWLSHIDLRSNKISNISKGDTLPSPFQHWDSGTFTTIRDSAVLRIVDNDFDWNNKTPRVVRRFSKKKKKGKGRWK